MPRLRGVGIFIEAGKRDALAARDTKGAIAEHAFGIDNVANHFANAPLAGRIAEARLLLRKRAEERGVLRRLTGQDGDEIGLRHQVDVAVEIGGIFGCSGSGRVHPQSLAQAGVTRASHRAKRWTARGRSGSAALRPPRHFLT